MNIINEHSKLYINSDEAAALLGIHKASIRNWIRHGYLRPINISGTIKFNIGEVNNLKHQISSGSIQRLNKRANKSTAIKTFVPEEYTNKAEIVSVVSKIAKYIVLNKLEVKISLFYLALNLLEKNNLIELYQHDNTTFFNFNSKNPYLNSELKEWRDSLPPVYDRELYEVLLKQAIPTEEDVLGFIYQSVLNEGSKAKQGSYYTPPNMVNPVLEKYLKPGSRLLDPCCGSGRYLLSSASFTQPINIYGFDIDEIAVRISRINLMQKFRHIHFKPNVFCYNMLIDLPAEFENSFDVIATNPPWGMHINNEESIFLKKIFPEIKSGESFSYFIQKGTDLLKDNGILSFILPESILHVKTHKDIRKYILGNYSICAVHYYGQRFKNVFTKVVRLDLKKTSHSAAGITVSDGVNTFFNSQVDLYSNADYRFSFYKNDYSKNIIEKVYNTQHTTLKHRADWALGIVTGDNKRFVSPVKLEDYEEVYTGREVAAYTLKPPRGFLKFSPEFFQQVAPVTKYRVPEKLIYKFISSRLVFAYDNQQKLTLNSANILIPSIPGYSIKTILALLNSSIYQFIFMQKFNSIKVLRSHLETLPLPFWENEIHNNIILYVNEILAGKDLKEELDKFILESLHLSIPEIEYIRKILKSS